VNVYDRTCRLVDQALRGTNWRALPLPGMLPMLVAPYFDSTALWVSAWAWFLLWSAFVRWRWWLHMRCVSKRADRAYDRQGKYRLSRDYYDSESATSAKARKKSRS
jgi:hypothetical protein